MAVAEDRVAVPGGPVLEVAGPPLRAGRRVGWSVRPERLRLNPDGRYDAWVVGAATIGGARELSLRLGDTALRALADVADSAPPGPCRLDIDPASLQVWEIT